MKHVRVLLAAAATAAGMGLLVARWDSPSTHFMALMSSVRVSECDLRLILPCSTAGSGPG